jgi:hypothetical protein
MNIYIYIYSSFPVCLAFALSFQVQYFYCFLHGVMVMCRIKWGYFELLPFVCIPLMCSKSTSLLPYVF